MSNNITSDNRELNIRRLAEECLELARDSILINMRFLDVALLKLPYEAKDNLRGFATNGEYFYYDPEYVLKAQKADPALLARTYLHSMLHCIFNHSFNYDKYETTLWDISCDIAIENMIMDLEVPAVSLENDDTLKARLRGLKKNIHGLTAQKIYRYFLVNGLSTKDEFEYSNLFSRDYHFYFAKAENIEISSQDWKKISERIKADIRSFSKTTGDNESLIKNLMEATKEKADYRDIMRRFVEMGEESSINDEEFDYIYYTYGMATYKNIPLIEPLEYRDVKKVKDFAIIIDTSASCRGNIVKAFLRHTYNIMKATENFFNSVNIHIIQCDNEVQSDVKITCDDDFDKFIGSGKLRGFGGTDFRPAFEYVDSLIDNQEFENFKGLIYFTDGYGIYPEKTPDYDSLFVFLGEDDNRLKPPWWAIRLELDEEDIMSIKEGDDNK